MAQGMVSAAAWALSGPLLLSGLIEGIFNFHALLGGLLLVSICIYAPLQYFIILHRYREIMERTAGESSRKMTALELISIPALSFFVIIVSSIPPYFSIFMEMKKNIFGGTLKKPKTES